MAKKIAFVSALGGQGCSLSAVCVAKASGSEGHPVTLVDLCGFGGTLSYFLGAEEDAVMNLSDVISGECLPEEALVGCGENLTLLPSGSFSECAVSPCSEEVIGLMETLAQDADVFADLPAGTLPDQGLTECFDMFVICSRPDRMSLHYSSALCRHIRKAAAHSDTPCGIRLLLTRFTPESMRRGGVSDIDQCIDTVGAGLIGVMPEDDSAGEAALSGQPPDEATALMQYARDTAKRLYGERVPLDSARHFRLRL